jgi:chromosome segregation ATPase
MTSRRRPKNNKIANLEENLRSPLGYENSRETRIRELEQENGILHNQLTDAESTVKAITLAANTKLDNLDAITTESGEFLAAFNSQWNSVIAVVKTLAEITSSDASDYLLSDDGLFLDLDKVSSYSEKASLLSNKLNVLQSVLQDIEKATKLLAGSCSDMAEGAGFGAGSFTQPEGTFYRIQECANMLTNRIHEISDDLLEFDRCRSGLELVEAERSSLQDEVYRLNDLVTSLQQGITPSETSESVDIQEQLASAKAAWREKEIELERYTAAADIQLRDAEAEIDGLKMAISNLKSSETSKSTDIYEELAAAKAALREKDIELERYTAAADIQLRDAEAEIDGLKMAISNLQNNDHLLAMANSSVESLNSKLVDCNALLGQKEIEINEIKTLHAHHLISSEADLNELKASKDHEFEQLKRNLEQSKNEEIEKLISDALKSLKHELSEKEAHEIELKALIDKFVVEKRVLEDQLSTVKAIAAGLEKELDEAKTNLSTTLANFQDQKDLSMSVLAIDTGAAQAESSDLIRLSQELSRAESAIRAKDKELLAALQDSAGAAGKISGLQIALRDLNEELEAVRKENASLEKRLLSQRGTHDLLKQEADEITEAVRKSAEESKHKDKVIQTLRQELSLVSEELKDSNRELSEKSHELFDSQNMISHHVDDVADFASWFHDILLSSLVDDLDLRNSLISDFNHVLLSKKAIHGNAVLEIISLTKEKVKCSVLSLESKLDESRDALKLKERELAQVKEKLEKAFLDMKRQVKSSYLQ